MADEEKSSGCINIKQAIQGLFTAGTSRETEKVGGKRGLKLFDYSVTSVTYQGMSQ